MSISLKTYARTLTATAAAVLLGAGAVGAAPASAAPPTIEYVNLGDSYAAGIGSGGIANPLGCAVGTGRTHVSQLDKRRRVELTSNAACAGFTTTAMLATLPVGDLATADLVTVTVGANDLGLQSILAACATGNAAACGQALASAPVQAAAAKTVAAIAQVSAAAPDATIVVFGYPHLFAAGALPGLGEQVNAGVDAFNHLVQAGLAQYVPSATYVSVVERFAGHEIGSTDPWINYDPANLASPLNFHPTTDGYLEGYFPALNGSIAFGQLGR